MELNEVKKLVKIKWKKFYISTDRNNATERINFNVTPDEFLKFAKEDYVSKDKKGLVNAITNSKRAIDCQIDWIISYLGYDYCKSNEKNYPNVIKSIEDLEKMRN